MTDRPQTSAAPGRVALPLYSGRPYPAGRMSRALVEASRPRTRHAHWQTAGDHHQLFVVNGSLILVACGALVSVILGRTGG